MKHAIHKISWIVALAVMVVTPAVFAQDDRDDDRDQGRYRDSENFQRRDDDGDDDRRYGEPMRIDRYLDVQVWPNRDDAEYYTGDNIVINFRANRDCFVAIYSIDSRGRVNLLFPNDPSDDNYVTGGVTYHLPGNDDRYDLVVDGPSGREHIQMVASREKFPIPNWYRNSGLVFDGDSRDEFMDDLNERHFVRYPGQRFALDRAVVFVKEWEPDYYRPIYNPYYPDWAVTGNVYIDYPWGGSVYINGIYWGVAPLYVPRLVVGWHVISVWDPWGYGWESDFHCNRYHTVVFDRTVVKTSRVFVSRYKEVNVTKWRDPVKHGYPNYKPVASATKTPRGTVTGAANLTDRGEKLGPNSIDTFRPLSKKYARGETGLVKTGRGYEAVGEVKGIRPSAGSSYDKSRRSADQSTGSNYGKSRRADDQSSGTPSVDKSRSGERTTPGYKQRGGSDDNSSSRGGRVERRRESEPSRVAPPSRTRTNSPSNEPAREQPKVEKKSGGESSKSAPAPSVKESPKSQPSSGRQAQPSSSGKSKGGDGGGKGKRP